MIYAQKEELLFLRGLLYQGDNMRRSARDRLKIKIAKLIEENSEVGAEFDSYDIQKWWGKQKYNKNVPSIKQISKILPGLELEQHDNKPKIYTYSWDGKSTIWTVVEDPYDNAPSGKE